MTEQLLIRIESELKQKLGKFATMEGKTSSQVVRDLIEDYVKRRDVASYVYSLWERIGESLRSSGATPADVTKAIRDVRRSNGRRSP